MNGLTWRDIIWTQQHVFTQHFFVLHKRIEQKSVLYLIVNKHRWVAYHCVLPLWRHASVLYTHQGYNQMLTGRSNGEPVLSYVSAEGVRISIQKIGMLSLHSLNYLRDDVVILADTLLSIDKYNILRWHCLAFFIHSASQLVDNLVFDYKLCCTHSDGFLNKKKTNEVEHIKSAYKNPTKHEKIVGTIRNAICLTAECKI